MNKILQSLLVLLIFLPTLAEAQYTGGRLEDTRLNVSIGLFTSGGVGDYQGAVGVLGSTGYTTNDVVVGDYLVDDTDLYRIDAVVYTVPGSIATIDVTWLEGTVGTIKAPITGRGEVIKPSPNLNLLLLLENGSNFITEEQEAKILTHNFLLIDSMLQLAAEDIYLAVTDQDITDQTRVISGDTTQLLRFDTVSIEFKDTPEILMNKVDYFFADTRRTFVFGSDTLQLGVTQTTGKFFLSAPNTNVSPEGSLLELIDPATGEAQWRDAKSIDIGGDTLIVVGPDSTYNVTNGDTIYVAAGGNTMSWYDAGNGAWVYATGTGITYTKSVGVGDFTIPADVILEEFKIVGGASDLNSGEIMIDINYPSGIAWNQSDLTSLWPTLQIQNRNVVLGTDPYQQRPDDAGDSVNIFNERWNTAGAVTVKITGLSGDFGIHGSGM